MAGHSHSANIRFRKDRVNAAKAKVFSKISRMLTVAAKLGGADPDANPRLRLAMDKARVVSLPKDNIERAIKKGAGGTDNADYEELLYEGYAPCGVAVMLEILTDNRNRTAPEIRAIFDRAGGNLGSSGSVTWMFERKAVVAVSDHDVTEERLLEAVLEVGADDLIGAPGAFEVRCGPADLDVVRTGIEAAGIPVSGGEVRYLPTTTVKVADLDDARRVLACLDALEDNDDVQAVYSNVELPAEIEAALAAAE